MIVIVFRIKIDKALFTIQLLVNKLEKAVKGTAKVLNQKTVGFIDMQSLVRFFSFCLQAVRLVRVFIKRFWDFINLYPRNGSKTILKKILAGVKEDLEW